VEERWWTVGEEGLEQQAQAAWALFPPDNIADPAGDLANPEDLADPAGGLADLEDAMAGLVAEPAGPDDPGDAPAFPWHLPEGMVLPAIAPEQPMMNSYHIVLPPLHPPRRGGMIPGLGRWQWSVCFFVVSFLHILPASEVEFARLYFVVSLVCYYYFFIPLYARLLITEYI
jgi:hypothetical protein